MPPVRRTRPDGVEVVRSDRRRRTVSAYRQDGRTIVLLPGPDDLDDPTAFLARSHPGGSSAQESGTDWDAELRGLDGDA